METTRRKFIAGLSGIAAASVTAGTAVAAVQSETQEEKCARLLLELMAECRKMPLPIRTRFGRSADIPVGKGCQSARYGYSEEDGEVLTVSLQSAGISVIAREDA